MLEKVELNGRCILRGKVVGVEARSGGVHHFRCIILVRRLGGYVFICFQMTAKTKGVAPSVPGRGRG